MGAMLKDKREKREMRAEYDFSKGKRGKYAERYAQGTNVVLLEPDVAKVFPDSESVNAAFRVLARIARKQASTAARNRGRRTRRSR
jgi:hypothetical protein